MANETTPAPTSAQPKIVNRLWVRTLGLILGLGALFLTYRYFSSYNKDPGSFGAVNTSGQLAAIEYLPNGQQAVVFTADGNVVRSPGYREGAVDRDIVWQPDGNRLYFVSDRGGDAFQVFRWKPTADSAPEARTVGSRSKSNPAFPVDATGADARLLMTSGGVVQELDPREVKTPQILPPVTNEIAAGSGDEEGGSVSQFAGLYGQLGESFRVARYVAKQEGVAAVMRRAQGEILVVQRLPKAGEKLAPPQVIAAGDRIDIAVNPADGGFVYTVQNFQWPTKPPEEFIKNGKVTRPFNHFVGMWSPNATQPTFIAVSQDDKVAFGSPAISPDGSQVLVVVGSYQDSSVEPSQLVVMPVREGGGQAGSPLIPGRVYEPTWHPNGQKIAYAKRGEDGKRGIYIANADGSGEQNVSASRGDFASPRFSPQSK